MSAGSSVQTHRLPGRCRRAARPRSWSSSCAPSSPLLPLRVVLDRNRGGTFIASLLVGAGLFAMFLFLSYYFQANLGYSALKSGFAFLPFSGGIIVTAGVVSALLPRTGPKPLMLVGLVVAHARPGTFTPITDSLELDRPHVLPGELLMSVGLALVFVPLSSLALTGVDDDDAGVASAVLNSTQQIGGSLGTALLNTFYASAVTAYITVAQPQADRIGRVQPGRGDPRLPRRVLDRRRPAGRRVGRDRRAGQRGQGRPARPARRGRGLIRGRRISADRRDPVADVGRVIGGGRRGPRRSPAEVTGCAQHRRRARGRSASSSAGSSSAIAPSRSIARPWA